MDRESLVMLGENIGYVAMVFVAISIAMKDVRKLRVFNMVGAICFVVYALILSLWPVLILNVILAVLNLYHLLNLKKEA